MGDLTVLNWDDSTWWLMGSYYLRQWHMRWFESHLPDSGVAVRDISDAVTGFSLSGPKSRDLLARLTDADVSNKAFGFMSCRELDVGLMRAKTARLSVAGELGYEINVPASEHQTLYRTLMEAGRDLGLLQIGYNALNSLRLEKSFGVWSKEFTWAYTPGMSGMDRFIDFASRVSLAATRRARKRTRFRQAQAGDARHRCDRCGCCGLRAGMEQREARRLCHLGGYGHTIRKSLAMAYVDRDAVNGPLEVHIVGVKRKCRVVPPSPYDPQGKLLRS